MNQRIEDLMRPHGRDLTEYRADRRRDPDRGASRSSGRNACPTIRSTGPTNSCSATSTSTSGCSAGRATTTPASTTTTSRRARSPSPTGACARSGWSLGRSVDEPIGRIARAGTPFSFGASDIHRVLHAGEGPAVTIHAYSPPLMRMGSYTVEPTGQLRRHAVSYEEELRQMDVAAS